MTNDSASVPDFVHTFPDILAPFVPTPRDVDARMLALAGVVTTFFLIWVVATDAFRLRLLKSMERGLSASMPSRIA